MLNQAPSYLLYRGTFNWAHLCKYLIAFALRAVNYLYGLKLPTVLGRKIGGKMSVEKRCQVTDRGLPEDDNCDVLELQGMRIARESLVITTIKTLFSNFAAFVLFFHTCVVLLESGWLSKSRQPGLKGYTGS